MEHSALADSVLESATQNLTHTYAELGRSTPGSQVWQEPGILACTGRMRHPICNFAALQNISNGVAVRARELALRQRTFSLYLLPPHTATHRSDLEQQGFLCSHELRIMVSCAAFADPVEMELAVARPDRLKIADFMTQQFFHRQPTSFRRGIAEATASATSLKLYRASWRERTAGAVMISEHAGIIGLYNLCIAPQLRSRGWGSAIVRTVVDEANKRHLSVTLQCEPSLASWYSSLGFKEVGSVSVFSLCRFKEIDIMG